MRHAATVALVLAAFGSGCTPKPRPPVEPTPPPVVSEVPAKGTPVAPEVLLRPAPGARVTSNGKPFLAFMAVPCCQPFRPNGEVVNARWPMASKAFMDYTAKYGANTFHFRLGPFLATPDAESEWVDVGGPYLDGTTDWNPRFWGEVRGLVWHAHNLDALVEVAVVDTWGCKYSQWGNIYMQLPPSEIEACGRKPSPGIERFIRKAVEELGCFGNVFWSTDVEGGQIRDASPEWFLWVQRVIRDEEQRSGCGFVHMIGTNSGFPEVEGQVDYVQVHSRTTLSSPRGRWTINNERNPAFPPEVEAANARVARDLGLAWALWRAEMNDADFVRTLELFRDVFSSSPAPQPNGCFAPDPEDPEWALRPTPPSDRPSQLMAAVSAARDAVGDRCGRNVQESLALVADELRRAGLCASGPWVDAVAVLAPDGLWEEHHAVAYTDGCLTHPERGYKGAWLYRGHR